MASVFSGVIPTVKVFKNSQANALTQGLLSNLATSSLSVALNQRIGAELYNSLGLNSNPNSNFIGSIVTPGLINTGIGSLNQTLVNSIVNSKALGPLGPLTGNLVGAGVNYLGNLATNALFGEQLSRATDGGLFFPGGGGTGEEVSNYFTGIKADGSGGKQVAYTLGAGGADVVFTISSALSPASKEANSSSAGSSTTPSGTVPATPSGAAAPAAAPSPGATPPDSAAGAPASANKPATSEVEGWTFICPPEDISWETSAQADRVPIFGANQAPVTGGVRGMRELSLNGAIVEGFCRGKSIEKKVIALEKLLKMSISKDSRYLQIPVYKVTANSKVYGLGETEKGYFVIKSIKVQEKMRDLSGNSTRALVDISLMQVPSYQVEDGRDIASQAIAGTKGPFEPIKEAVENPASQAAQAQLNRLASTESQAQQKVISDLKAQVEALSKKLKAQAGASSQAAPNTSQPLW